VPIGRRGCMNDQTAKQEGSETIKHLPDDVTVAEIL
jgi:hypothetical protein